MRQTAAQANGAGGHTVIYLTLRNTSGSRCVLKGYPQVIASEPGLPDVAATNGSFFQSPTAVTANLDTGDEAMLGLETDTYCDASPGGGGVSPPYHHLDIRLPGGGTIALDRDAEPLHLVCGLHLTRFFISPPMVPEPHDPLSDLQATLDVPSTVTAGTTLTYLVDLSNPTGQPISLTPCPGYIQSAPAPNPVKATYALNCTATSAIPAGQTLRFEMRMPLPIDTPAGPLTITWALIGPGLKTSTATVNIAATPQPTQS